MPGTVRATRRLTAGLLTPVEHADLGRRHDGRLRHHGTPAAYLPRKFGRAGLLVLHRSSELSDQFDLGNDEASCWAREPVQKVERWLTRHRRLRPAAPRRDRCVDGAARSARPELGCGSCDLACTRRGCESEKYFRSARAASPAWRACRHRWLWPVSGALIAFLVIRHITMVTTSKDPDQASNRDSIDDANIAGERAPPQRRRRRRPSPTPPFSCPSACRTSSSSRSRAARSAGWTSLQDWFVHQLAGVHRFGCVRSVRPQL